MILTTGPRFWRPAVKIGGGGKHTLAHPLEFFEGPSPPPPLALGSATSVVVLDIVEFSTFCMACAAGHQKQEISSEICQASNWFEAQTKLKFKGNVIKAFDGEENAKNEHLSVRSLKSNPIRPLAVPMGNVTIRLIIVFCSNSAKNPTLL